VLRDEGRLAEAAELHEQALAMNRNLFGEEHPGVAISLEALATVLERQGKLSEAESVLRKALAVRVAVLVPEHPTVALSLDHLAALLLSEGKLAEAEPLARQCLAIREKRIPDDWRTFSTRSLLGGVLSGQKKYAEAEPLLTSGYEGLRQRQERIPADNKPRLKEAAQWLAQLFEATSRPEKAAALRAELTQ
jgi:eukaryotic-like serine/threonine-protein kinase